MAFQCLAPVVDARQVAEGVHTLAMRAPEIARATLPGQFLNIKPDGSFDPLLRRAYSVHRVLGDDVEVIFNVVGRGSAILAAKEVGEEVDLLGPLGVPFHLDGNYRRAVLVSGGVGIAPMPVLAAELQRRGVEVVCVHGARRAAMIPDDGRLPSARYATDDGSAGVRGNVIDALRQYVGEEGAEGTRVFACGPNRMLEALGAFCGTQGLPLEVSLECQMACGVGICQGCPVEMAHGDRMYTLVCTHGPNYDIGDIVLSSLPSLHG